MTSLIFLWKSKSWLFSIFDQFSSPKNYSKFVRRSPDPPIYCRHKVDVARYAQEFKNFRRETEANLRTTMHSNFVGAHFSNFIFSQLFHLNNFQGKIIGKFLIVKLKEGLIMCFKSVYKSSDTLFWKCSILQLLNY